MAEIERNVIAPSVQLPNTPEATFPQAADSWMETKRQEVGEGTARYYAATLRQLKAFFGRLKLSEIQREHITEYRRQRQVPHEYDGRTYAAGPITINHEISTLFQILERAGLRASLGTISLCENRARARGNAWNLRN